MTIYCGTLPMPMQWGQDLAGVGVSDAAATIKVKLKESVNHFLEPRLRLLIPEIQEAVSEEDSARVQDDTIRAAKDFARTLPRFGPLPEISVDPDGEISFDWIEPSGEKMVSVSVNGQNRLAYAGWFGEKSRVHGIEQLGESCPQEILLGIQKAIGRP